MGGYYFMRRVRSTAVPACAVTPNRCICVGMWRLFIILLLAGCGFTQPVPKGEGSWADAAGERVKADAVKAFFTRVESKTRYAAEHPTDLRANREAVELTRQALEHAKHHEDGPTADVLIEAAAPVVRNLNAHEASCATNLEVAKMYRAASMDTPAVDRYVDSMSRCRSVAALRSSAYLFERLGLCDDLQPHAAAIWPSAGSDEQVDVLDAVAICSTPVSLRPNLLAFAPESVVQDYLLLLDARAAQRARQRCESSCWSAYDSCSYGCWGGSCGGCEQVRSLCEASCR